MKMKMKIALICLLAIAVTGAAFAQGRRGPDMDVHYQLGPDSLVRDGVPKGEIEGPFTLPSEAYPGTQHTYWTYVPAQYDSSTPASLMVFNDGQAYMHPEADLRAQNVMDNLIYRREIPVMIGVFINPGRTPEQPEPTIRNWGDRDTNRPDEYNSLDDRYARVIVDELLPELYKKYNISKDPEQHGIGGSSSGAIAAFTVAWKRPNHFRKVLSMIGTYVNLRGRGGSKYPDIIRESEKKPLRVFLQDGRNDNRGRRRNGEYRQDSDWFYQNVRMMKSLTGKGYEVNYIWGIGRHSQKHAGAVLPEMMRWLWRDHTVSTDPDDTVERSFQGPVRASSAGDLEFRKVVINADSLFSAAAVFDVDHDGDLDIVGGGIWYEAPNWERHTVRDVEIIGGMPDGFAAQPHDVNGDGWMDFFEVNWRSRSIKWIEHPGESLGEWTAHTIAEPGPMESGRLYDVDGDGRLDLLPNGARWAAWWQFLSKELPDGTKTTEFIRHELPQELAGHGIAFGDINGDGRGDVVSGNGWAEAPEDRINGT